jgi:hypothetical protein
VVLNFGEEVEFELGSGVGLGWCLGIMAMRVLVGVRARRWEFRVRWEVCSIEFSTLVHERDQHRNRKHCPA